MLNIPFCSSKKKYFQLTQKLIKQQNSARGNWKGLGDESYRVSVTEMRHLLWWSLMQTKCFFYWSTVSSVSATKACLVNTNSVPSVYVCVCLQHWNGETVPQYCSWPSRQPVYLAAPIYSADTYSSCHLENDCVILSRFAFRVVRCRLIKSNLSNMLCVLPTGGCSGGKYSENQKPVRKNDHGHGRNTLKSSLLLLWPHELWDTHTFTLLLTEGCLNAMI